MKILSISLKNFASYKNLDFNFEDQGLTLIQGPTGAGKSTLCDALPWILFGTTAKGGAVNEVLAWNAEGPTEGIARLKINGHLITIVRSRNLNDLYYRDVEAEKNIRGKDLNDTQKLINNLLGMDADLYLAGAYYHEFSQTAQFFQTTAKNRRSICEQLVDLSLPKTLQEKTAEKRKLIKIDLSKLQTEYGKAKYKIDHLMTLAERQSRNAQVWEHTKGTKLLSLRQKLDTFEETKSRNLSNLKQTYETDLKRLRKATVCSECGATKDPNITAESPFKERIQQELERQNTYAEQIADLESEINPYIRGITDDITEVELLKAFLVSNDRVTSIAIQELEDLELLSDTIDTFRAILISNTISNLEDSTNKFLSDHFDAEIRLTFTVEDADKVEVSIFKNGNTCVYTQLSKGQRCLLKLCFGVSVMKEVANHNGIKFHQVFFDEALDGLDGEFKLKAINLLQSLEAEYESIFLVEHSFEVKAFISNSYNICLVDGHSVLNEEA